MDKLGILSDWYRRVWIEEDLDAIDEYFAPRCGADGLMPDGQVGAEDFRALVPALRALVRDIDIRIDRHVETGDWLWAQIVLSARTAHGIDPVGGTGQVMLRFDGGRITEAYNGFDFISFFEQVGLLPKDAFLLLLSGERMS